MTTRYVTLPGLMLALLLAHPGASGQQPPQVPGAIRSRITLVPVDVTVLDRNNKPVTDLTREHFTVLENGVRQEIRHFSQQFLVAHTPAPGTVAPPLKTIPGPDLSPQTHRIFLLVLGRGRLQGASKDIDAVIRFVRTKLLPQDHVAVLAWNRATDFATDHEKVAQTLDRFKARHEAIEALLAQRFSGLAALYGSREIPAPIQREIDRVFGRGDAIASREITPERIPGARGVETDTRRAADAIRQAEIVAERQAAGAPPSPFDASVLTEAAMYDLSFEEYISKNLETMQDLGNIYAGIQYLRYLEGEKHLVYLSAAGLFLPRLENDKSIAAAANDARVTIDIIHTGGVVGVPSPIALGPNRPFGYRSPPLPTAGAVFGQTFAVQTSRLVSELTGGQAYAFRSGESALGRIDQATRSTYLLGYYPTNATWDGAYRRIAVKVNRPGTTVLFRHGYYGRQQLVPLDRQQFLTYSRMAAAANYVPEVRDLALRLKASVITGEAGGSEVLLDVTIDGSRLAFTEADGRRAAQIEVAIFCADAKQRIVGERWQTIDLKINDDVYRRLREQGIPYTVRIPVTSPPRYVKMIAYHYNADILGSAVAKLE